MSGLMKATGTLMGVVIIGSYFCRRGDVMRILGLTRYQLDCMISSKAIIPVQLPGMTQKVFKRKEIEKIRNEMEPNFNQQKMFYNKGVNEYYGR